jgi:hypothetical protein
MNNVVYVYIFFYIYLCLQCLYRLFRIASMPEIHIHLYLEYVVQLITVSDTECLQWF